jgi:4a-hydroxytetrahydrobiopterin dehydratase
MALLARREIDTQLRALEGWTFADSALQKQFTFAGFPEAVAFVSRIVVDCENDDHHPDVTIKYRRVTLTWTTHSEGGVTSKDIDGARMAERHYRESLKS